VAVWYRQSAKGQPTQTLQIEPHAPDQPDADLLAIKARGAADKGWTVKWTGDRSFTATKKRWGDVLCTRKFWAD
jgi:hypothetical protein